MSHLAARRQEEDGVALDERPAGIAFEIHTLLLIPGSSGSGRLSPPDTYIYGMSGRKFQIKEKESVNR